MQIVSENSRSNPPKQISVFEASLPRKPYASSAGPYIRPCITTVRRALKRDLIQVNHPGRRVWMPFDIDRELGALAWETADLPCPFFTCQNRENGHVHSAWLLEVPVVMADFGRKAPMRWLEAIERAMTAKLQADPGYGGMLVKNPASGTWRVLWDHLMQTWDLHDLSECLPDLDRHKPIRKCELTGVGRNVDTFDGIRKWAYGEVLHRKRDGVTRDAWIAELVDRCRTFTAEEHGASALGLAECRHIAKSIGKWTWARFDEAGLSKVQQARIRKRWGDPAERNAEIVRLRNEGLTIRAIAGQIGISKTTVQNVLYQYHIR